MHMYMAYAQTINMSSTPSSFRHELCHELYHLNVTTSINMSPSTCLQLHRLFATNSVIYISPTLWSKYHELYHLNVTNSINLCDLHVTNSMISVSRTLLTNPNVFSKRHQLSDLSARHELYHLHATNSILKMPRTLFSKCHELYSLHATNSIIYMPQTLLSKCHELYCLNATLFSKCRCRYVTCVSWPLLQE